MEFNSGDIARLVYLALILLSISGWFVVTLKNDFNKTIQRALIWFLIFFGFAGVYGFWTDYTNKKTLGFYLDKASNNEFKIKKAIDGHFYSVVKVNNKRVNVLVDTGATKTLLSIKDAAELGIPVKKLEFKNPIQTANGISYSATYNVENFEWLGREYKNFKIQIASEKLFHSLLGMDVLSGAEAVIISNDLLLINF